MSKYFYRYVIFILLIFFTPLFAQKQPNIDPETANFLKELKKQSDDRIAREGILVDKNFNFVKKNIQVNDNNNSNEKNSLFYFYSESMPFVVIKNLIPQFYRYKKLHPSHHIYIVFNGFPSRKFFLSLRKIYDKKYKGLLKVKFQPFMYKYFNLHQVPAFVFMKCGDDFRFSKCEKKDAYLTRGDISLQDFFDILAKNNKSYKTYYINH